MATTTLQFDSNKIIEPLKEINELLGEIISKLDTLRNLSKVDGEVIVSKEDLKTMRELAEMKDEQSFVTLTPTINVCCSGNYSVDEIIERITETLEKEISSAALKIPR